MYLQQLLGIIKTEFCSETDNYVYYVLLFCNYQFL